MNHMAVFDYDEAELQRAITYLSDSFTASGTNKKPVILHSIRVASLLWSHNASQDAVMSGILHDLIEDTLVTEKDIKAEFGPYISKVVESLTFDKSGASYDDKLRSSIESFHRSKEIGIDALSVRASDLIDNSNYYDKKHGHELCEYQYKKFTAFMELAGPVLRLTPFWNLLEAAYETNVKDLARTSRYAAARS